nr:ImmA/IrrE family metallo-endopeptidase [Prosthecochloris sp. HL-130-GSB]
MLTDDLAPLVFLNAADSKAAQMFTLAHELAHVWVGISGLSDPDAGRIPALDLERWCNKVAAEIAAGSDELSDWLTHTGGFLFIDTDSQVAA